MSGWKDASKGEKLDRVLNLIGATYLFLSALFHWPNRSWVGHLPDALAVGGRPGARRTWAARHKKRPRAGLMSTKVDFDVRHDGDTVYLRFKEGGVMMLSSNSWHVPAVDFPTGSIEGEVIGFRVQPIYKHRVPVLPPPDVELIDVMQEGEDKSWATATVGVDGPTCMDCGGMTQRTGTCYTCIGCGSTTGCG